MKFKHFIAKCFAKVDTGDVNINWGVAVSSMSGIKQRLQTIKGSPMNDVTPLWREEVSSIQYGRPLLKPMS